jgi:hypothetical protein
LIAILGAIVVACVAPVGAACAPKKLVNAVMVDISSNTVSTSFAGQPRRSIASGAIDEEADDPGNGIHGLVVVAETSSTPDRRTLPARPYLGCRCRESLRVWNSGARPRFSRNSHRAPCGKNESGARGGKLVIALRYDLYDADLMEDPQLFVRPAGITYEDAK